MLFGAAKNERLGQPHYLSKSCGGCVWRAALYARATEELFQAANQKLQNGGASAAAAASATAAATTGGAATRSAIAASTAAAAPAGVEPSIC